MIIIIDWIMMYIYDDGHACVIMHSCYVFNEEAMLSHTIQYHIENLCTFEFLNNRFRENIKNMAASSVHVG